MILKIVNRREEHVSDRHGGGSTRRSIDDIV